MVKVQLCEYENQTLDDIVAVSSLYGKFDSPKAHQNFSLLAIRMMVKLSFTRTFEGMRSRI